MIPAPAGAAAAAGVAGAAAAGCFACVVCPLPARRPASARAVTLRPAAPPARERLLAGIRGDLSSTSRSLEPWPPRFKAGVCCAPPSRTAEYHGLVNVGGVCGSCGGPLTPSATYLTEGGASCWPCFERTQNEQGLASQRAAALAGSLTRRAQGGGGGEGGGGGGAGGAGVSASGAEGAPGRLRRSAPARRWGGRPAALFAPRNFGEALASGARGRRRRSPGWPRRLSAPASAARSHARADADGAAHLAGGPWG